MHVVRFIHFIHFIHFILLICFMSFHFIPFHTIAAFHWPILSSIRVILSLIRVILSLILPFMVAFFHSFLLPPSFIPWSFIYLRIHSKLLQPLGNFCRLSPSWPLHFLKTSAHAQPGTSWYWMIVNKGVEAINRLHTVTFLEALRSQDPMTHLLPAVLWQSDTAKKLFCSLPLGVSLLSNTNCGESSWNSHLCHLSHRIFSRCLTMRTSNCSKTSVTMTCKACKI